MKFKSNIDINTYPVPKRVIEPAPNDKIYFYLEPIILNSKEYFTPKISRNTKT